MILLGVLPCSLPIPPSSVRVCMFVCVFSFRGLLVAHRKLEYIGFPDPGAVNIGRDFARVAQPALRW